MIGIVEACGSEVLMQRKRVGIVLFEDIEVLDFCGPFEVFSATRSERGATARTTFAI